MSDNAIEDVINELLDSGESQSETEIERTQMQDHLKHSKKSKMMKMPMSC